MAKVKQYFAVTNDVYELVLGSFDTVEELAQWAKRPVHSIETAISMGMVDSKKNCKYVRVLIHAKKEEKEQCM